VLAQQQLNRAEHTNLSQSCHPGNVKVKKQAATEVAKFLKFYILKDSSCIQAKTCKAKRDVTKHHPALEHLQWYSVCDPAKIFLTSKFSYLRFSKPTYKTKTGTATNRWETTNSNPPGPTKLSSQSTASVRL